MATLSSLQVMVGEGGELQSHGTPSVCQSRSESNSILHHCGETHPRQQNLPEPQHGMHVILPLRARGGATNNGSIHLECKRDEHIFRDNKARNYRNITRWDRKLTCFQALRHSLGGRRHKILARNSNHVFCSVNLLP